MPPAITQKRTNLRDLALFCKQHERLLYLYKRTLSCSRKRGQFLSKIRLKKGVIKDISRQRDILIQLDDQTEIWLNNW